MSLSETVEMRCSLSSYVPQNRLSLTAAFFPPHEMTCPGRVHLRSSHCVIQSAFVSPVILSLSSLAGTKTGAERDAGPGEPQRQPGKTH